MAWILLALTALVVFAVNVYAVTSEADDRIPTVFSTRRRRVAYHSFNFPYLISPLQRKNPPRFLAALQKLSVHPKKMRASQNYRGIPMAILKGNVMPKEAVRYSEGLASGNEMRIAAGAAI